MLSAKSPVMKRASATLHSLLLLLLACNGGSEPTFPDPDDFDDLDSYIASIEQLPTRESEIDVGTPGAPYESGDYRCVQTPISEVRAHAELVAFAANSNALWPGSIVRGDAVADGELAPLVWARKPMTFSISLENLDGAKSATVDEPSLSSFREALGEVLAAEVTGATPARISSEIEIVHSQEQLALALGASASWPGVPAHIAASFDFNDETTRSRYLVKFTQAYFTLDVDPPSAPSSFIADSVTIDEVAESLAGTPPVYVSSLTYGRRVMFSFSSSHSAQEVAAALSFAYKGGAEVSGDVSLNHREVLDQTEISAYIVGGSGEAAVAAIGSYEGLVEFIQSGGNYGVDSPGAPIAYKLAYLSGNAPARLSFTSDYDRTECERVSQNILATLESVHVVASDDPDDTVELSGSVLAIGAIDGGLVWSGSAEIGEGTTYPSNGSLGEVVMAIDPTGSAGISFSAYLYDDDFGIDVVACDERLYAEPALGFRRSLIVRCREGGNELELNLSLRPIN